MKEPIVIEQIDFPTLNITTVRNLIKLEVGTEKYGNKRNILVEKASIPAVIAALSDVAGEETEQTFKDLRDAMWGFKGSNTNAEDIATWILKHFVVIKRPV